MRLINPGPGEVADRLTILALKILFGQQAAKDTTHFERERAALLVKFRSADAGKLIEPLLELAAVNGALWHKEDELREWRDQDPNSLGPPAAVVACAFQIQSLNDRRATLVGQINTLAGDAPAPEKLR
jgi:hypothetical protein